MELEEAIIAIDNLTCNLKKAMQTKQTKRKTLTSKVKRLRVALIIMSLYSIIITVFTFFYIWLSYSIDKF